MVIYCDLILPITQVLIWLKETKNPAVLETEFQLESVRCGFQVVRMWEQPPEALLQSPALLPMAVLCQAENPTGLLNQVASEVAKIKQPEEREEIISSTQLLAGLRFKPNLIRNLFQGGLMRESTVFQEILQEGRVLGRGEGRIEGELAMIYRQLPRRIGTVAPELQQRLLQLSVPQLEDLGEALLDFSTPEDLIAWLNQTEATRIEGRREGSLATIYRLLPRRIGTVTPELQQRLLRLSVSQLEDLGEALLDFSQPDDLIAWLDRLQDS